MKHTIGGGRSLGDATPEQQSDSIRAALAGDRRAQRALVEYLLPVVRARTARVMRRAWGRLDDEALDEFQQAAWVKIWGASLRAWTPDGGKSLRNWVGWAAENAARNLIAKAVREPPIGPGEPDEAPGGEDTEKGAILKMRLQRLCDCLHDHCTERDLVIARMLRWDGSSTTDVARALGTSAGQVYKASNRFKRAMHHCLAG